MSHFISYAQNFEDVMLWRALKHIRQGFYVDVGANDPEFDSVTKAFYEMGWRGVNIEPMQEYYEALCRERPEDVNLPNAVAATEGEIKFYEVPETGLSTVISEAAHSAQKSGRDVVERTVETLSLNKILEEHACEPIHFLKIDVEGFEAEVIKGIDLSRWRPWIILVEATIPSSSKTSYDIWEPMLLSAAYRFIYFDGLNRFYMATEHAELAAAFAAPPNVFDRFTTLYQEKLNKHIACQESVIRDLNDKQKDLEFNKKELDALRPELDWARGELPYLRSEIARMREEGLGLQAQVKRGEVDLNSARVEADEMRRNSEGLRAQINYLQAELKASQAEAKNLRHQYVNILYSQSYRITAPLRLFYRFLSKLRRGGHNPVSPLSSPAATTTDMETGLSPIKREQQVDEQYYMNLFKSEIDTRKKIR